MIAKPLSPDDPHGLLPEETGTEGGITVDVGEEEGPEVTNHDDGSVTVDFDPQDDKPDLSKLQFEDNLAEALDDEEIAEISSEVLEFYRSDEDGRSEWKEAYAKGMNLLGLKVEERSSPWKGAAGVFHPLLMEAVVRFQSQAIMEIFPPAGPAKTRITGKESPDVLAQSFRMEEELNYQLTVKMPDYRSETERKLFYLAACGAAFTKVYYDPSRKVPAAKFVPAEDFVVPYGESNLDTAERFTHVLRLSKTEMSRFIASGLYRDVDLTDPAVESLDGPRERAAEIAGVEPKTPATDRYVILEMHLPLDLGEGKWPLPYVVCIEENSRKILSIRRNWREGDDTYQRRSWFVDYAYVPGIGFYGLGLIHLIGGVASASTSILRQLIDAGTLSNLPGGLKSRGLRIKGDDTPVRPGEWRDVDIATGKIADSVMPLPYKEPSGVLFQLLGQLVDEGRRVGSTADVDVGDMNAEAPVGTTLALLERAQKVMSAVQARLHASLQRELNLIAEVIKENMPPQYDYDQQGQFDRQKDFAGTGVQIIPVSDPGATTMSQRVVQHTAAMQMASQAPQAFDIPKLARTGLEILGFKNADEIVPQLDEMKPVDPVTENMAILKGEPVKAFIFQDHQAHLAVHLAAIHDPKIQQMVGQSPNANTIMSAAQAHIMEHVAFEYRQQVEQASGQPLPTDQPGQKPDPQQDAQVARMAAAGATKLLKANQAEASQQEATQMAQDPMVQLQTRELAIKEEDLSRKSEESKGKLELERMRIISNAAIALSQLSEKTQTDGAKIGADAARHGVQILHEQIQQATDQEHQARLAKMKPKPNGGGNA